MITAVGETISSGGISRVCLIGNTGVAAVKRIVANRWIFIKVNASGQKTSSQTVRAMLKLVTTAVIMLRLLLLPP